jgi:hypothetical protein
LAVLVVLVGQLVAAVAERVAPELLLLVLAA